jgi:carboxyl-terminal processing protease
LKNSYTRYLHWLIGAIIALWMLPSIAATPTVISDNELSPEPQHEKISQLISKLIRKFHYLHTVIDDDLSSMIFDQYIDVLDNNRIYLQANDVDSFEIYRYQLDDIVKTEPLNPIFKIFEVYRLRVRERLNFALLQLEAEPDFNIDEHYMFSRKEQLWLQNKAQLDDFWRRRIKNDAINLKLADKDWMDIQEILRKRYTRSLKRMDQIKSDDVFEIFMNAFSHTLDPHSSYLSPRSSEEYRIQTSLSYFGIGASLQINDDYVMVMNIIPGGPAAIDGKLQPKDKITAVAQGNEGELVDVIGWRLDDVVQLIRGPAETIVRLQIMPAGSLPGITEKIITLARNQVKLEEQAAKSEIITVPREGREWKIGVIKVPSFYRDVGAVSNGDKDYMSTTKDVRDLITELNNQDIDGLIVDLRNNGGGHLIEAQKMSGLFIDNGPIVQLRHSNGRISRLDDPDPVPRVAYNGPLAVLINRYSASASEIFSAAIQDYSRGLIIGQQTFGKGTVQNLYSLAQYVRMPDEVDFGQLTLTIGKYYRVTGESTQHKGVKPDIALPSWIDSKLIGESVRETAMPWDTIKTSKFRAGTPLSSTIATLMANHISRNKNDPDYQYLIEGIRDAEQIRIRKSVSLNINDRRAESEAYNNRRLNRENTRRAALQLEPVATLEELEITKGPDIHLDQATAIITDLAQLIET